MTTTSRAEQGRTRDGAYYGASITTARSSLSATLDVGIPPSTGKPGPHYGCCERRYTDLPEPRPEKFGVTRLRLRVRGPAAAVADLPAPRFPGPAIPGCRP
jgi:hypothetical protein